MSLMHPSGMSRAFALGLALSLLVAAAGCGVVDTATEESKSGDAGAAYTDEAALSASPERMAAVGEGEMAADGDVAVTDAAEVPPADRLVIRTAGLRINVDDVEASTEQVRTRTAEASGVVTDVQISTDSDVPVYRYDAQGTLSDGAALSGWITVRVPADSYDAFVASIKDVGEVVRQSESESDVTQEHIDLTAQLDNLKAQEQQLREFYEQAADVDDLLAIEQELTRVRSEIDSLEAQIAYLERQSAMSTVTVELVGPQPVVSPQGESWGFVEAITAGIRGAANVVSFAIAFIIATSPIWLAALAIVLIVRLVLRRRRDSAKPSESE